MFIQSKVPALNGEVDGGAESTGWVLKDPYDCNKASWPVPGEIL